MTGGCPEGPRSLLSAEILTPVPPGPTPQCCIVFLKPGPHSAQREDSLIRLEVRGRSVTPVPGSVQTTGLGLGEGPGEDGRDSSPPRAHHATAALLRTGPFLYLKSSSLRLSPLKPLKRVGTSGAQDFCNRGDTVLTVVIPVRPAPHLRRRWGGRAQARSLSGRGSTGPPSSSHARWKDGATEVSAHAHHLGPPWRTRSQKLHRGRQPCRGRGRSRASTPGQPGPGMSLGPSQL